MCGKNSSEDDIDLPYTLDLSQSSYPIERLTGRRVAIASTLTNDILLRSCNLQSASPLFSALPNELRALVFAYATADYGDPDPAKQYKHTNWKYRSGFTAPRRSATELLLTCRRSWPEANALSLQQTEHTFWFSRGRHEKQPDWHDEVVYARVQ